MLFDLQAATLLGTATLAVQTIVLASSLAASLPARGKIRDAKRSSRSAMEAEAEAGPCSADLDSVLDTRAFWVISLVRLVAMPVVVTISTVVCPSYSLHICSYTSAVHCTRSS